MAEISDFVVIDDNNVARFPEGMAFAQVNNSARADEGILARWFQDIIGTLVTAGTATAYTLTPNRTITAYYKGLHFRLQFNLACGAAPTINVSGLGAKNLTRDGNIPLNAGDVQAAPQIYDIVYDGTEFQVVQFNLSPLTLAATGNQPLTLRRTENDTASHSLLFGQSGNGSGNAYALNEFGGGANNVVGIQEFIGATVLRTSTATSHIFGQPLDLTEVATPAAPGAGLLRFYAKTTGQLAFREGASGLEQIVTPIGLPGAQGLAIVNDGTNPNFVANATASAVIVTNSVGSAILLNTVSVSAQNNAIGPNGSSAILGGLDVGPISPVNTWLYYYIIYNPSTGQARGCFSLNSSAPSFTNFPGFSYFMRVGAMLTDASSNFTRVSQIGNRATYTTQLTITASGSAQPISPFFPPTCQEFIVQMSNNGVPSTINSVLDNAGNICAGGTVGTGGGTLSQNVVVPNLGPNFSAVNNGGGPSVFKAYGWRDRVNAT